MMTWITDIAERSGVDVYTMRARIQPAMLVALPIALSVLVFDPGHIVLGKAAWSLAAWAGGTALVAQLARDRGKSLESMMFTRWGGTPSTVALRYRGARNAALVRRRHEQLQRLLPGTRVPNATEETADPPSADAIYDTCVNVMRDRTRDKLRFPLVFEENCNYGFRRNVWGLKPFGIVGSLVGVAASMPALARAIRLHALGSDAAGIAVAGMSLLLLCVWLFVISEKWVRVPAEAYAERIFEACESLI